MFSPDRLCSFHTSLGAVCAARRTLVLPNPLQVVWYVSYAVIARTLQYCMRLGNCLGLDTLMFL
jgi:hypothetical protein